jgi:hypothetical protein
VLHLIGESKISDALRTEILREAILAEQVEVCKALNICLKGSEIELFFHMVRTWAPHSLLNILESISLPGERNEVLLDLAYHISLRYKDKPWQWNEHLLLTELNKLWYRISRKENLYAILLGVAELCHFSFRSKHLEALLRKKIGNTECPYALKEIPIHIPSPAPQIDMNKIVQALGFTFEKDAAQLSYMNNYGLVHYLLEQTPFNKKMAMKVLSPATFNKIHPLCIALYKKGVPLLSDEYDNPFFGIVRDWDAEPLKELLYSVQLPELYLSEFKEINFYIAIRYRDRDFDENEKEIFEKLAEFGEQVFGSKKSFYKAIIHEVDDRQIEFVTKEFENNLRELAQD